MTFTDPNITFTFVDGTTNTTRDILQGSLNLDMQRMKDLKSSSNVVRFTLAPMPLYENGSLSITGRILSETDDIKAELRDGEQLIFTGYVSNSKQWGVASVGSMSMDVMLEDVGTRRMKGPCSERKTVVTGSVREIVDNMVAGAGVTIGEWVTPIDDTVYVSLDPGNTVEQFVGDILYEYGAVYFFNAEGHFCVDAINVDSQSEETLTLWAAASDQMEDGDGLLYAKGRTAVTLKRRISDYKSVRVCYPTVVRRNGVPVFSAGGVTIAGARW